MKKILFTLLTLCLLSNPSLTPNMDVEKAIPVRESAQTYSISSFTSLPSNWSISSYGDTNNSSITYSNNQMHIKNNDGAGSVASYYGSLVNIATNLTWTDFSFEMTFSMTDPLNDSRWFGIGYHTQMNSYGPTAYMMNYRYNGQSAASIYYKETANVNPTFADYEKIYVGVPLGSDVNATSNASHTIKITMKNRIAVHYVDGIKITEHDTSTRDSTGNVLLSGGFSLIVNQCTLNISSISISSESGMADYDYSLASTYTEQCDLLNPPTVVLDAKNETILDEAINSEIKPSNVILRCDENMNVISEDGEVIDSFDNIYTSLNKRMIPVVYVEDTESANAFINYLSTVKNILDIAVASWDPNLVNTVKTAFPNIRGVISFDGSESLYDIVYTTQINKSLVAMIPIDNLSVEAVRYIQGRFKTVWAYLDETNEVTIVDAIVSGAYGIVTEDYISVYDTFHYCSDLTIRNPFNVAHRGCFKTHNENSLSGVRQAISIGATHLEIDVRITTDNEIYLMHDNDLARTTNAPSGTNIESITSSQVNQYQLDLYGNEVIPTLDQIIDVVLQTDVVIVLEIKSGLVSIVEELARRVNSNQKYQQILEQMVVITFSEVPLKSMSELLPQVPLASLNDANASNFTNTLQIMGKYNCVFDTNLGNTSKDFNERYLRDRGIVGWYWTFQDANSIRVAENEGYIGLTNNEPDCFNGRVLYVYCDEEQEPSDYVMAGDSFPVYVVNYNGVESLEEGYISSVVETDTQFFVTVCYEDGEDTYLAMSVIIDKITPSGPGNNSNDATSSTQAPESPVVQPEVPATNMDGVFILVAGGVGAVTLLIVLFAILKHLNKKI